MRWVILFSCVLVSQAGLGWAQEPPKTRSISDVTLSVVSDAGGLDSYLATLRTGIKQAWIGEWPSEIPEPGSFVVTLRINHAGYLGRMDGGEFVPTNPAPRSSVLEAVGHSCIVTGCDPVRLRRGEQINGAM